MATSAAWYHLLAKEREWLIGTGAIEDEPPRQVRTRHTTLTTASPRGGRTMAGFGRSSHCPDYLPGFNDFAVSKCFCNVSIWPEAYSPAASLILDAFLYSVISF